MSSKAMYPVAILIDELKSEDAKRRYTILLESTPSKILAPLL